MSVTYFTINPLTLYGSVNTNGTQYEVVQTFSAFPATGTIGESGPLDTSTIYHDNTKAVMDGSMTATYSVTADSPSDLDLCTNAVITASAGNPDGLTSGTQTNCYRVDSTGNATLFKVVVEIAGTTLTFR